MLAPVPTQHPLQFQHPAYPLFLPSLPSSCFWQYKLKEEILVSHEEELQKEKPDVCNKLSTSFVHFYMSCETSECGEREERQPLDMTQPLPS